MNRSRIKGGNSSVICTPEVMAEIEKDAENLIMRIFNLTNSDRFGIVFPDTLKHLTEVIRIILDDVRYSSEGYEKDKENGVNKLTLNIAPCCSSKEDHV